MGGVSISEGESIAANIISGHVSRVEITKKVNIEEKMLL